MLFGRVSKVVNSQCYHHKPSQRILTEVKLVACYREVLSLVQTLTAHDKEMPERACSLQDATLLLRAEFCNITIHLPNCYRHLRDDCIPTKSKEAAGVTGFPQ